MKPLPQLFSLTVYNHSLKVEYYTPWPSIMFSRLSGQGAALPPSLITTFQPAQS